MRCRRKPREASAGKDRSATPAKAVPWCDAGGGGEISGRARRHVAGLEHDFQQSNPELFARFVDRDGSAPGQDINRQTVLPALQELFDIVWKEAYHEPTDTARIIRRQAAAHLGARC